MLRKNNNSVLLACLAIVCLSCGVWAGTPPSVISQITDPLPPFVGTYESVALPSSEVNAAVSFAIKFYNSNPKLLQDKLKAQVASIQLKSVVSARKQTVSGINFSIECKIVCKIGDKTSDITVWFLVNSVPWTKTMTVKDLKKVSAPAPKPSTTPATGTYKVAPVSSKDVIAAVNFAVKHLNSNPKLLQQKLAVGVQSIALKSVVSAQQQVIAGIRFKVDCKVVCKSASKSEEVTVTMFVVYVPWTKKMTFENLTKVPIAGGYALVALPSKPVNDAVAFAIKHLNSKPALLQQKLAVKATSIALKSVLSAQQQIVAGVNYVINCKVTAMISGKASELQVSLYISSVPWQNKMTFMDLKKK